MAALHKALQDFFREVWLFLGAAGLKKFAVSGSQGSLAYSVHFSSSSQKGEQQTWKRFKEGNKEDQRTSLGTASAQAVTQRTAPLQSRRGDSRGMGSKSVKWSCTEKVNEEQLLTASSAAIQT